MNPTLPQIAFWLYAAIGLAVALYLWLSSVAKQRIKTVWWVGSWVVLSEFIFFAFLLLWPLWLGVLWLAIRNERRCQPPTSPPPVQQKPNKAPEPTPPSVMPRADARVTPAGVVAHL